MNPAPLWLCIALAACAASPAASPPSSQSSHTAPATSPLNHAEKTHLTPVSASNDAGPTAMAPAITTAPAITAHTSEARVPETTVVDEAPERPLPVLPDAKPAHVFKGPCVDVHVDAVKRTGMSLPEMDARGLDLNGDGVADYAVFVGAKDIKTTYLFYIRERECGRYVTSFSAESGAGLALPKRNHGLFDLETSRACRVLCCQETTVSTWRFDGKRYVLASKRQESVDCGAWGP